MQITVEPIRQGRTGRVGPSVLGAPEKDTAQTGGFRPRRGRARGTALSSVDGWVCVLLVVVATVCSGAPLAAQPAMCGLQPEVVFHEDSASGAAYAVTVSGSWPTTATDVRAELASQPNADGELRLDIAGTAGGILIVGHYERTVPLPRLPPGPYSLEVYMSFEAQGVPYLTQYCGSFPFFGAHTVPTLGRVSAIVLGCVLALGALATFRRRRLRSAGP